MVEDRQGNLWFGTSNGLIQYDGTGFKRYGVTEGLIHNNIQALFEDSKGNLWLGTEGGVNRFDRKSFTHFTVKEGLSHNNVRTITEDEKGNIWFGTAENGIIRFDGKSFAHYSEKEGLSGNSIWDIAADRQGNLWIATARNGVNRFDGNQFTHFTENEGLASNDVQAILEDSQGNLWFSTRTGGICRYNSRGFRHFSLKEGLSGEGALAVTEDSRGNIWFGGRGVCRYDGRNFACFTEEEGFKLTGVWKILEDRRGNIWFGGSGLASYDGKSFTDYSEIKELGLHSTLEIMEDSKGKLWFGTYTRGASCFDGESFIHFNRRTGLNHNTVHSILEDSRGRFWFGTYGGGANCYDGVAFRYYSVDEGLNNRFVVDILEDSRGGFWFGAEGGGVNYFDGRQFTHYTVKEGLSNNTAGYILEDNDQNIWVNTFKGISLITPDSSEGKPFSMRTFGTEDGLNAFEYWFAALDSQNRLWFTSDKGISLLDLDEFKLPSRPPAIVLNHIEVNQQFVDFRQLADTAYRNTFSFGQHLARSFDSIVPFFNYPARLELPHHINHLTFHFSGIDWAAPHKIRYSYILEGLDEEWSILTRENKADYRNLPFGRFTFKVRAMGVSLAWSEPFEYSFTILPPWYRTWWAYGLYVLAIGGLFLSARSYEIRRQFAKAEARQLRELDNFKSRFYTNISHEFRTPLTIILGMAQKMKTDPPRWLEEGIHMIQRNGQNLLRLVNQMLDLSKLESGKLKLNPVQGDVIPYLRYIFESFHSYAEAKDIRLHFHSEAEELIMDYDPDQLLNVVSNLLSNAVKFTPKGGEVRLSVSSKQRAVDRVRRAITVNPATPLPGPLLSTPCLLLSVSDTGCGIPEEKLPHIFDRFYQADDTHTRQGEGTGIGLALVKELIKFMEGAIEVESTVGEGSEFTVYLPIRREAPLAGDQGLNIDPLPSSPVVAPMKPTRSPEADGDKPTALIVEDNADVVSYVISCLEGEYQLEVAYNGQEGIDKAVELVPDIIVTDVMMPEKDGFELCDTLKRDIRTSHIPVVMLTAKADMESRISGLKKGADAYLAKPFHEEELRVRMEKLLELRRHLQEKYRRQGLERVSMEAGPETEPSLEGTFLREIRRQIEEHLTDESLDVSKLCRLMAMSRTQLHRKLTALTGMPATKFIRSVRLNEARELLRKPGLTISEVAYESGFSSPNYFSRAFSEMFGMSPTEYRDRKE